MAARGTSALVNHLGKDRERNPAESSQTVVVFDSLKFTGYTSPILKCFEALAYAKLAHCLLALGATLLRQHIVHSALLPASPSETNYTLSPGAEVHGYSAVHALALVCAQLRAGGLRARPAPQPAAAPSSVHQA